MMHLSEDELVEQYYEDGTSEATAHLKGCRECSARYTEVKQNLDAIAPLAVPQRSADYGERVWEKLHPHLVPYEKKTAGWRAWGSWRAALIAAGCAVLLAAVFVGGRYWERATNKTPVIATNPQASQRVVLVVLTDHLDRTERLLVELEHARGNDSADQTQLQSEARELLASNRLYRVTARNSGDPEVAGALDKLEGVLAEIANEPRLSAADIERVRKDMNTKGILFEIRILRAHSSDEESGARITKGATI